MFKQKQLGLSTRTGVHSDERFQGCMQRETEERIFSLIDSRTGCTIARVSTDEHKGCMTTLVDRRVEEPRSISLVAVGGGGGADQ